MRVRVFCLVFGLVLVVASLALAQSPQEYDVVVVGGGGAGLVAATAAAEQGVSVVVLERRAFLGGNTLISGGVFNAVNPEFQEPMGIEDSVDLHYEQTLSGGDHRADPRLVRVLVENALDAVHRTMERGLEFYPEVFTVVGALWPRTHSPVEPAGTGYIRVYSEAAQRAGAEIMLGTEVIELVREPDGRVTGVKAISDGEELEFRATKGVVLATGGFGANVELRMLHDPQLGPHVPTTNHSTALGDGILMAQDIGAATRGMDFIQLLPEGNPETGGVTGLVTGDAGRSLVVNQEGNRFVNEGARRDELTAAFFRQTNSLGYRINDVRAVPGETNLLGENIAQIIEEGKAFKADSIRELAELINIPADVLVETVETYNQYVRDGIDPDFDKPASLLVSTIEEPPFYGVPRVPSVHHTMGGVVINDQTEVLDRRGNIIPGLYAAGEVTGGIHGANRLGGNAITDLLVFGWMAGEAAAAVE